MRYAVIGSSDWRKWRLWFGWATTAEKLSFSSHSCCCRGGPALCHASVWPRCRWAWHHLHSRLEAGRYAFLLELNAPECSRSHVSSGAGYHGYVPNSWLCSICKYVWTRAHKLCSAEKVNQAIAAAGWVSCLLHTETGVMEALLPSHMTAVFRSSRNTRSGQLIVSTSSTMLPIGKAAELIKSQRCGCLYFGD